MIANTDTARTLFRRAVVNFVAIVVGVLTALAVDAWYNRGQDDQLARQYSVRISDELTDLQAQLTEIVTINQPVGRAAAALLPFFESGARPDSLSGFVMDLYNFTRRSSTVLSRSTYDDLIATGNLRLLSAEIRDSLADAYDSLRRLDEYDSQIEYRDIVRGLLPIGLQLEVRSKCGRIATADFHCELDLREYNLSAIVAHARAHPVLLSAYRRHVSAVSTYVRDVLRARYRVDVAFAMLAGTPRPPEPAGINEPWDVLGTARTFTPPATPPAAR